MERLGCSGVERCRALVAEVEACRSAIEQHVEARFLEGDWGRAKTRAARVWVAVEYPWMSRRNVRHAVRQATYYAWHG